MLWEDMNACWTVHNVKELKEALEKVHNSKKFKPYSQIDADKYIEELVYGGKKNRDVLGEYAQFILSSARHAK